jgi:hypothetical protein
MGEVAHAVESTRVAPVEKKREDHLKRWPFSSQASSSCHIAHGTVDPRHVSLDLMSHHRNMRIAISG